MRLLKRFYRDTFKAKNKAIVRRRYKNCETEDIKKNMTEVLINTLGKEIVTEDLIYYTIGILNFKKSKDLPCNDEVKKEIEDFLVCVRKFSKRKFIEAFKSENFRIL